METSLKSRFYNLLRKSERYTKTDMVYLAQGGFWLGIGQFISSLSAFLTSIAFANLLSPEIFGLYKYIISIVSLLTITTLAGMDSAVTQAVARGFEGTLIPGMKEKMKWGAIGSGLSLIIGIYYFLNGNPTLALSFSVVALFMPFTESLDIYNSLLFGKKLFNTQTIYNSIKKIIALVCIIGAIFITRNIYILLFVYFASIVLPNLFFLWRTVKIHKKNNENDKDAIPYGKHLSAIYIIALVAAELDRILVFQYVGPVDLAIYSLATAPTDQVKGLLKNLNSLAMPQFSEKTPEEIKKSIWGKVKLLAIGTTIIILAYILLAPLFFSLFFPKYLASVHYSQVLSISLIPVVISGFIYTALEAQKAKKELYRYNTYTNIFGIIILFPLVYYFGIWGAISSRIMTRLFSFGLISRLMNKLS